MAVVIPQGLSPIRFRAWLLEHNRRYPAVLGKPHCRNCKIEVSKARIPLEVETQNACITGTPSEVEILFCPHCEEAPTETVISVEVAQPTTGTLARFV